MIYEYALDPALVVDWAIGCKGRFVGQFGMDQRRLVSDYPKDWAGAVFGAFYEHFDYDDGSLDFQNAQPELQSFVQWLSEFTVQRDAKRSAERHWLQDAVAEHIRQPFHAIMTTTGDGVECREVITPEVLDNLRDSRWYLPTIGATTKSAEELAAAIEPMLRRAKYIVLVDPYFDAADARYQASFSALIQAACRARGVGTSLPAITVMTGIEQKHKRHEGEFTREAMARVANNLCVKAQREIPKLVPRGMRLDFYCLKHPDAGDPLHNRYVLTDIGGVIAPYGLADYKPGETHGAKDDLTPMPKGMYVDRHRQYVNKVGIDTVLDPIRIEGPAE
jgi:hypothetical protein